MSGKSYKSMSEEYKMNKKKLIDGYEDAPHKKKGKKKKNKRSKHKHEYIPAVYHLSYSNFNSNKKEEHMTCGSHCSICGRVKDMRFIWSHEEERIEQFKKEYPNYIEVYLPDNWDYFRNKVIPVL